MDFCVRCRRVEGGLFRSMGATGWTCLRIVSRPARPAYSTGGPRRFRIKCKYLSFNEFNATKAPEP